jgi:hypothetical protein
MRHLAPILATQRFAKFPISLLPSAVPLIVSPHLSLLCLIPYLPSNSVDNIYVMSPVFQQDSVLLTLPFGGAVLRSLGMSQPEVEAILEDFRRLHIDEDNPFSDDTFNYLSTFGPKKVTIPEKSVSDKKDKEVGRERDKDERHDKPMKDGVANWDGTEEQEKQEEEQEMHEYSRITRILNERNLSKEAPKKVNMNGMIGGVEESTVEPTDSPVSVYLDGSSDIDAPPDAILPVALTTAPTTLPPSIQGVGAGSGPVH